MKHALTRVVFWDVLFALYVLCGLFTAFVTAPLLPDDYALYARAVAQACAGRDPYHPFGIGASFVYPPTALFILWPLQLVPPASAWMAWAALSGVLYVQALRVAWSAIEPDDWRRDTPSDVRTPKRRLRGFILGILTALLFAPFVETVVVGQTNVLVMLGVVLFVARKRVRPWVGEAGLAVAVGLKVMPAVLLAVPMVRRDWRTVRRAVIACAALVALSIVAFGATPWLDFREILPGLAAGDQSGSNQAAAVLLAKAATRAGAAPDVSTLLGGLTIVLLIGWLVWTAARATPGAVVATELFGVSVVTMASSVIWYHHLTLLAPVLLMAAAPGVSRHTRVLALVALALIQTDRAWEVGAGAPPLAATAGSLAVAYVSWKLATDKTRRPSP